MCGCVIRSKFNEKPENLWFLMWYLWRFVSHTILGINRLNRNQLKNIRFLLRKIFTTSRATTFVFLSIFFFLLIRLTAWKVLAFRVILVLIFPHSDWIRGDTKRYRDIQSECGKIWIRITPNTDTFYEVAVSLCKYFPQPRCCISNVILLVWLATGSELLH